MADPKTEGRSLSDIPELPLRATGLAGATPELVERYERGQHVTRAPFFGEQQMVFLVGPELNRYLLTTGRHQFSHGEGWGKIAFGDVPHLGTLDGEPHDQQRRSAAPAFQVKRMDGYLPMIDEEIRARIATWADRDEVDAYEEVRRLTFDLAARAFLGCEPGPEMELIGEGYYEDLGRQRRGARREADAMLRRKIADRRDGAYEDALAYLSRHVNDDGSLLNDEQLLAHARFLLAAGYETSASLAAWCLYMLILHPDYRDRVMAELATHRLSDPPTYEEIRELETLDRLSMEAERLYPPVPYGLRGTTEPVEVEGYHLPKGTLVSYGIAASHTLPSYWENPGDFDPDRFAPPREEHKQDPYLMVGFGGGPRRCIGMTFARAEIALLVARVCARYDLEAVEGVEVKQLFGITSRPLGGMRMRAKPRASETPVQPEAAAAGR
jgi:cytochrome P450